MSWKGWENVTEQDLFHNPAPGAAPGPGDRQTSLQDALDGTGGAVAPAAAQPPGTSRRGGGRRRLGPRLDRGTRQGAKWSVVDPVTRHLYTRALAEEAGITGELFQSRKEAKVYIARLAQQDAGAIRNLRRGKRDRIPLHCYSERDGHVVKVQVTSYEPDFLYDKSVRDDRVSAAASGAVWVWVPIVEDVKGWRQDIYKLKRKWVLAEYGIEILET